MASEHSEPLRIVVAAGGTGGHLYPGIAIVRQFQARCPGTEVVFLGGVGALEARLIPREGLPFRAVRVAALKGRSKLAQIGSLGLLAIGTLQATAILARLRPHLVIGTGGYVMGPAVLAAALLRCPRVIMEQNVLPGMTVRALARVAQRVFTAFPETAAALPGARVECTGTPVRQDICEIGPVDRRESSSDLRVLIFGGSQGAHRINQAVVQALPCLARHQDRLHIMHQTGEADYAEVARAYREMRFQAEVAPFFYDMAARYRWAHLVICRAGASTLAELMTCGRAAILIPYPYAADDHQRINAEALERQGAAQVIADTELTGERLYQCLTAVMCHPECLLQRTVQMRRLSRPLAAEAVVTSCLQLLGRR
jgi:UDP-N-acetylglucosamine--N-acetylmuramyl-(pentapeptide) pyrophosphoryl-undecaprenol N-acetylglucosamine transferase